MPCNSDYLDATAKEVAMSQVACLIDELDGKADIDPSHWRGYHPRIINKGGINEELFVEKLCSRLQGEDVSKRSLEMQIWWRDHQKADRRRSREDAAQKRDAALRRGALRKLTPAERHILGVRSRA